MSDYERAVEAWMLFHQKLEPSQVFDIVDPWPERWGYAGLMQITFYSSDKWKPDGDYIDYYHDHGQGVGCWQPWGSNGWLNQKRCPVKRFPEDAAVLGYSGGWIIKQVNTSKLLQAEPTKGSLLCCFPDHRTLFCLHPKKGVTALFHGPGLHIEDRGIVG